MKKIVSLALALAMILSLVACGGGKTSTAASANPGTSSAAPADEHYVIKMGQADTQDSLLGTAFEAFKEYVETNTNGKVEVQLFHNAVMGGESEMLSSVQMGTLDICSGEAAVLSQFGDQFGVINIPFLFRSEDELHQVWENGLEEYYNKELASQKLEVRGMATLGGRGLSNSKRDVHTPDDMKGLKIRVMESPLFIDTFTAMGANPTPMSFSEVYTGLQQGTIDGQDNPANITVSVKFYEVQPYYTFLGHTYCNSLTYMRAGYLDKFPEDIAAVIADGLEMLEHKTWEDTAAAEEAAYDTMIKAGVSITRLTDEEYEMFKASVADVADKYRAAMGEEVFQIIGK